MARHGTRADATWHARPRGKAMRAHASAWEALMWRGRVVGPREPTRTLGWPLRDKRSGRLACDGPMGIVGPG